LSAVIHNCDVAIIGAGLAGATLALQLKAAKPELSITVFERSALPPPAAAHKVGESTVEIGAHYLAHTLKLKELLQQTQLSKFGLRFFLGAGQHADIAQADEIGGSSSFSSKTYQLDRGTLEGSLTGMLLQQGIALQQQSRVQSVQLAEGARLGVPSHQLKVQQANGEQLWKCGYVVDASGRASLLQRQLSLGRTVQHKACSAWFRLDRAITVDDWSEDPQWRSRCPSEKRWLSTNHLMGPGYWLWIIPLAGNRTSIGLVTDPELHPLEQFNSMPRFLAWTRQHQPAMAARLEATQNDLMDFHYLRELGRDCRKTWSEQGWAMTGESGQFTDPYYSPGTDYIGIANGIITDLVTGGWSPSELLQRNAVFNAMYRSFFSNTMSLYQGLYAGFGDTRLIAIKTIWDFAFYWSALAWLFFRNVYTDLSFMQSAEPDLRVMMDLNSQMQLLFRKHAAQQNCSPGSGRFIDLIAIPVLYRLNEALLHPVLGLKQELAHNRRALEALVPVLQTLLSNDPGTPPADCGLLGDLAKRLV